MKKIMIVSVICVVLVSAVLLIGRYFFTLNKYKKIISAVVISDVDLTAVGDGIYQGSFDAVMIEADVSVTIKKNEIVKINIDKHKNDRGQKAEIITDHVISAQSLQVDTISGATNSSKVILKAIENALYEKI